MNGYLRDGRSHELEVRFSAEDLYVLDGLTLEEVGQRSGLPLSTLKRWSSEEGWVAKREEYRRARSEIRRTEVLARQKLISDCLTTGNPMSAFAFSSLEGTLMKAQELALKRREVEAVDPHRLHGVATVAEAVAALQEAVQIRLARMLTDPAQVSFGAIRDLQKAFELLARLKAQHAAEDKAGGKSKGLSRETAELIKEKILGKA